MRNELTVRSTGSGLNAACLAKKERLEAALVSAIDAKTRADIQRELARIEQLETRRASRSARVA